MTDLVRVPGGSRGDTLRANWAVFNKRIIFKGVVRVNKPTRADEASSELQQ